MISRRILTILVCLGALITGGGLLLGDARGQSKQKNVIERDDPIQIVSDRLEAYSEKKIVVFSGNIVATQGGLTIHSDRLTLHYRDDKKTSARTEGETAGKGNLERVEATGHVTITEGERIVTGDQAVFEQDSQKITMIGSAIMREGTNVIRGDRIIVFLNENRGVVEGSENGRVTATIYPEKQQDKKR